MYRKKYFYYKKQILHSENPENQSKINVCVDSENKIK